MLSVFTENPNQPRDNNKDNYDLNKAAQDMAKAAEKKDRG